MNEDKEESLSERIKAFKETLCAYCINNKYVYPNVIVDNFEEDVKEFIRKSDKNREEFELWICGIVYAETPTKNTIECIREAFKREQKKADELAGGSLV
ncbi:hypothetical protein LCGC14_0439280 [marine sediment metagenome]|uniref:Uncharacterized protein n=1 Tax=marine sediment metagenome TaxID=412755 RepID=A0A0F9SKX2_9ZZZZ